MLMTSIRHRKSRGDKTAHRCMINVSLFFKPRFQYIDYKTVMMLNNKMKLNLTLMENSPSF